MFRQKNAFLRCAIANDPKSGSMMGTLIDPSLGSPLRMSNTTPISPPEEVLRSSVLSLRNQHPTLGVAKLHALLLSENSEWAVSEKRLRRIMTAEGLTLQRKATPAASAAESGAHIYPSSTLIEGLDVAKWTAGVEVKYFDKQRGKGLVTKEPILEGQVVWKEDPFIIAPEWCVN